MTNFLLSGRNINAYNKDVNSNTSGQASLVVICKIGGIVKLFEVILSISFEVAIFSVDQIFDETAFSPLNNSFIEKFFYLKKFNSIGITFYKD